jgi:hypothetical protein
MCCYGHCPFGKSKSVVLMPRELISMVDQRRFAASIPKEPKCCLRLCLYRLHLFLYFRLLNWFWTSSLGLWFGGLFLAQPFLQKLILSDLSNKCSCSWSQLCSFWWLHRIYRCSSDLARWHAKYRFQDLLYLHVHQFCFCDSE